MPWCSMDICSVQRQHHSDLRSYPAEKHVLPNFLIEATGTAFVMYPLKLVVTIPVLFIIDQYLKGESKNLIGLVKLAILTVGLAPAIRDILRMSLGI